DLCTGLPSDDGDVAKRWDLRLVRMELVDAQVSARQLAVAGGQHQPGGNPAINSRGIHVVHTLGGHRTSDTASHPPGQCSCAGHGRAANWTLLPSLCTPLRPTTSQRATPLMSVPLNGESAVRRSSVDDRYIDTTVLVTGAASGIGRAIAFAAAREGARLILGDVTVDRLADAAEELRARGAQVVHARCDITSTADLESLVQRGSHELGPVDVAFANAGVLGSPGDVWSYSEDEFTRILDINVTGTWRTVRAVLPTMIERRRGIIVATASA